MSDTNTTGTQGGADLVALDRRHVWHPFTQARTERDPVVIARAAGDQIFTAAGTALTDLISSWWTCTHGHAHPELNAALAAQAALAPHVMFAGFTHEPAVRLATALAARLPGDLSRVFFSDDGSTSVEVALKAAHHYHVNQGQPARRRFIAFDGGYHGDTLGAMAVGRGSGFFEAYQALLMDVARLPFPATWIGDDEVAAKEQAALAAFDALLAAQPDAFAGLIIEPLVQGAGGMRMCRPGFLKALAARVRAAGLLLIFDEVATGFGRTGTLFACEQAGVVPDMICLSKGLTAGYLPMSVTVVREAIYERFLGEGFAQALAHGHSFTANPLACAVANQSLALFEAENTLARIGAIHAVYQAALPRLMAHPALRHVRVTGSILAFDVAGGGSGYKSELSLALRDHYLAHGLNIRPLGPVVYLMPPYCITQERLEAALDGMLAGLDAVV